MSSDPLNAAWEQAQHKSFEELKAEANRQKALRENLQPMALGKGQYASIFKVGDRLRPELALRLDKPEHVGDLGSGQVDLPELIPAAAFRDLDHALAQAAVGTQAETEEGIREEMVYDADEAQAADWAKAGIALPDRRLVLNPPAVERITDSIESAAIGVDHLYPIRLSISGWGHMRFRIATQEEFHAAPPLHRFVDGDQFLIARECSQCPHIEGRIPEGDASASDH